MAEIDLLKVWESGKEAVRGEGVSIDVHKAIRGKSRSTLRWISIILWIELAINVLLTPFIYVWWKRIGLTWQFWIFLAVVLVYVAYYVFLIRSIQRFDFAVNVREGLRRIYGYLSFYLLHYKVVIWVLFPLCYLYGLYVGMAQEDFPPLTTEKLLIIIGISIVFNLVFSGLFNWIINLIYGRKIKRLKSMVSELEAAE